MVTMEVNWEEVARNLAGALDCCVTQIQQMKGLFPDDDGNIADALQEASKTVPILRDGDQLISDSFKIALYLEDAYPDHPSLFGGEGNAIQQRDLRAIGTEEIAGFIAHGAYPCSGGRGCGRRGVTPHATDQPPWLIAIST